MESQVYYILTTDRRDSGGKTILRLCCTGPAGYAEILISNKPVFFIKSDTPHLNLPFTILRKKVDLHNFSGEPLDALYFNNHNDLKSAASQLAEQKIATYESDIDPVRRYLMEKSIYGSIKVTGDYELKEGRRIYINPAVEPAEYYPELTAASVDIETSGRGDRLYSIAVHITGTGKDYGKVFMIGEQESSNPEYEIVKDEMELLLSFFKYLKQEDPDVITGWHVIGFDLMFLERKCIQLNINLNISRDNSKPNLRQGNFGGYFAYVTGRLVVDGPVALRSVFYNFEDYKLETVARELLGEGKTIGPSKDKVKVIEDYFRFDKLKLAEYNLQDAVLVSRIFQKTGLIDLIIKRSILSGLAADQIGMMTAAFDHVYLPKLHKNGYAAPDVKDIQGTSHAAGGYVFDPDPGIYENVIVLDFKSLYPSIIMTFKIDPLARLKADEDPINTPVNIKFSSTRNILPGFIEKLMKKRTEAKKNNDKQLSTAIKLLMNSFYGVMGSYGCRFYHPDLPNAITGTGQWLLLGSKKYLEAKGYKVIYGDTDSLFVKLKENETAEPANFGSAIAEELNLFWETELKDKFNVISYLEIEYEKFYRKFVITPARGGEMGAKKRYAGLLVKNDKEVIEFTGMESIRSDWTRLAKDFQAELYRRIFGAFEIDEWVRDYVASVKKGLMNDKLVYKKRIRKDIVEYKNLPPQVKAAKMLNNKSSSVRYVITLRGPVPVELEHNDIDYQHYIDKQLKPVADSVLVLLGKTFDSVINPHQYDMFK